jgi:hypothetical protein
MSGTTFNHDRAVVRSCAMQALRPGDLSAPVFAGRRPLRRIGARHAAA